MSVQQISSKDQFDAIFASNKLIFVDFYADWCGPCKQISPVFNKLANENAREGVEFYKVNIDNLPEVANEVGIRSIPVFHAYKGWERVNSVVGADLKALNALVQTGLKA